MRYQDKNILFSKLKLYEHIARDSKPVNLYSYLSLEYRTTILSQETHDNKTLEEPGLKCELAEAVSLLSENLVDQRKISFLLDLIKESLKEKSSELRNRNEIYYEIEVKTVKKLTISRSFGLGMIPFGISISLHPFLNIPYIPSSSIKGAFRSSLYSWLKINGYKDDEIKGIVKYIFESDSEHNHLSWLIFTDAFPINSQTSFYLIPDIITPHYTPETKSEIDVSPNPLIHLVVPEGVTFKFFMGYNKNELDNYREVKKDFLVVIPEVLVITLFTGIGAKTSLGYSEFSLESMKPIGDY